MGIVSTKELARTTENEIGIPATAVRRWAVILSDDTLQNAPLTESEVLTSLGLTNWGTAHPTWTFLGLRKITITERMGDSPYHAEAVAEYGYITANEALGPTSRRADWKFESQPGQVATLFYYHGDGDADVRPLVNSANDFFEGLVTDESMIKITINKNFWPLPSAYIAMQNCLNNAAYMTCPQYTLKCTGVTSDYTTEYFSNTTYQYWATQIELMYRQSSWVLKLPDVGWNYVEGGQKRRAMVFDFRNGEWVASANPVGLNGSGLQTFGQPAILTRRVNPSLDFEALLGVPPTTGTWPIGSL